MKTKLFAVFNRHGFVRATKRPVAISQPREVGVMIEVDIPGKAFDDGFIHASIAVPEGAFVLPQVTVAAVAAGEAEAEAQP